MIKKICLFYQYISNMNYWMKWFKNKYGNYIDKGIATERSFHLKNGVVLYFRTLIDNMRGQRFDKELNGDRLELLCLEYENKELHNKIDKLVEWLKYKAEALDTFDIPKRKETGAFWYTTRGEIDGLLEILKDNE